MVIDCFLNLHIFSLIPDNRRHLKTNITFSWRCSNWIADYLNKNTFHVFVNSVSFALWRGSKTSDILDVILNMISTFHSKPSKRINKSINVTFQALGSNYQYNYLQQRLRRCNYVLLKDNCRSCTLYNEICSFLPFVHTRFHSSNNLMCAHISKMML